MPIQKQAVRSGVLTAVNCLLIVLILAFSAVLALSSLRSGSFSIFGCSWHYYQSDAMAGEIERNELIAINNDQPADFQPDDIVAFYADDASGRQVIQIARLLSVNGDEYTLVEAADGEPFVLSSRETVFVGTVAFHSERLGNLVQQMRTREGRQIFFGWSVAVLMFACGLTILLHVQRERRLGPSGGKYPDDEDGGYYEDEYGDYGDYDDYDEDYPEEEGMRLDRLPAMPPEDAYPDDDYDGYDPYEDDRAPEDTGYVDEQNMNLIAASTESEDEEDADFDAIFREIERTLDKDGRY